MRKQQGKTQAGVETWAFICELCRPVLPAVASKTQIKAMAYEVFQVGEDFPQSRVDEASQERNGWATKAEFENRAQELGLISPPKKNGIGDDATRNLQQLRLARDRLCAVDPDFGAEYAQAINWAIRHLGTSE